MFTAIFVAAVMGVLWWLGRSWLEGFRQGGYDEASAEEARRDLEDARKQKVENEKALEAREAERRRAIFIGRDDRLQHDEFERPDE